MLDPEVTDAVIVVREGEATVRERVRKTRGIEVYPVLMGACPVRPTLKMFGLNLVAWDGGVAV